MTGRALIAAMLLSACDAPPPPPDPPSLARIELTPVTTAMGEFVLVFGDVGAAPSRVDVSVVALDLAEPPLSGPVARDGSFLIEPRAPLGSVVRAHTSLAGQRSAPVDFVVALGPAQAPAAMACLRVPLAIDLDRDARELEIANDCASEVIVERIRLRRPAPIAILAEAPIAVAPSSAATIALEITGAADEIVLVELAGGERRAVSVFGGES